MALPFKTGNPYWGHMHTETPQNVTSEQSLYCLFTGIYLQNILKLQYPPETPKITNGFAHPITLVNRGVKEQKM